VNKLKLNIKEDEFFTLKDLRVRQYATLIDGPMSCTEFVGQVIFIHNQDDNAVILLTASNLLGFTILNECLDDYIVRPMESGESFEVTINTR
jgi:hypothetical protein